VFLLSLPAAVVYAARCVRHPPRRATTILAAGLALLEVVGLGVILVAMLLEH
jgi:hypothetical protein